MSVFRKARVLSVSQLATIFAFHQISIAVFPRVIVGTLGVEEDPLAMTIRDHFPIIGTLGVGNSGVGNSGVLHNHFNYVSH